MKEPFRIEEVEEKVILVGVSTSEGDVPMWEPESYRKSVR